MKRLLFGIIPLVLFFGLGVLWWKTSLRPVSTENPAAVNFTVLKGQGVREISRSLKDRGLVRNQIVFFLLIRKLGLGNKIQAGEYQLNSSMSAEEIAKELTHGTSDVWLTIPEGLRTEEILEIVGVKLAVKKEALDSEREKWRRDEGYLFPDTYRIPKSASLEEMRKIMKNNFDQKVANLKTISTLTPEQTVILASIVEKEAKLDEDRPIVAGILIKRFRQDWPLEADATTQYALGYDFENKIWWRKSLTTENLKIDSPYNTRRYKGLPPGPICSPGLAALEAVLNSAKTDYWFYLSDKTGKMHYAKTLEEHNSNIAKYL